MKAALLLLSILPLAAAGAQSGAFDAYLEGLALRQLAGRDTEVARLTTRADWNRRRAEVRRQFLSMLGELPEHRTPLNLRRVGRLDRGDYRVEKIIFESLPKAYVTANLYIPQTGRPPYPAVLHPTGHSVSAKNRAFYQTLSIGLAKQGFVTLTYDPIGQGERRVFYDADLGDSKVGTTTVEHTMLGVQCLLAGESVARYMIWDAMRGLDVLESLPEVDRTRLGVTGCSGGGTMTVYLAALDPRIKAAAPACYVTSWEQQIRTAGPQDGEQQFPNQLRAGIDHADLLALAAPMPYLVCSSDNDFFPLEGARRTVEAARGVWALYGAPEKIDWFHEPGGHGIYQAGRERVYAWMRRWLKDDVTGAVSEPPIRTEYEEDLNCTSTGQIATSLKGDTLSTLNTRRYAEIVPARSDLRRRVQRLTAYEPSAVPLSLRSLGGWETPLYRAERWSFDSDRSLTVSAILFTPRAASTRVALYLNQAGAAVDPAPRADVLELVQLGYTVLALDPSGVGQLASRWQGYADQWFGQEKAAWVALMTGRPLVGLQVRDVLRGLDVLKAKGLPGPSGVLGVARGLVAVSLLHGAVLDPLLTRLVLEDMPVSYAAIARAPIHRGIFEIVIPGVLREYDLPDLAASVAPRRISLLNARSAVGTVMPRKAVEKEYGASAGIVTIGLRREGESLAAAVPGLR
jgi:hypothetical protein